MFRGHQFFFVHAQIWLYSILLLAIFFSTSFNTNTVLITVGASPTNRAWSDHYNIDFPILSDFWPHGEVAKLFGCFHEGAGISLRYTYITNEENVITEIIKSDEIGVERNFSEYSESFGI